MSLDLKRLVSYGTNIFLSLDHENNKYIDMTKDQVETPRIKWIQILASLPLWVLPSGPRPWWRPANLGLTLKFDFFFFFFLSAPNPLICNWIPKTLFSITFTNFLCQNDFWFSKFGISLNVEIFYFLKFETIYSYVCNLYI